MLAVYVADISNSPLLGCSHDMVDPSIGLPCITLLGGVAILINLPAIILHMALGVKGLTVNQSYVLDFVILTGFYYFVGLLIDKRISKSKKRGLDEK